MAGERGEGFGYQVSGVGQSGAARIEKVAIDPIALGTVSATHLRSPSGSLVSSVFSKPFSIRMYSLYLARKDPYISAVM